MESIERERRIFSEVDAWIKFVDGLEKPCNDIQRMRNHYLCITYFSGKAKIFVRNLISIPMIPICYLVTKIYGISYRKKKRIASDAVQFIVNGANVSSSKKLGLPDEIKQSYKSIEAYSEQKRKSLFFTGYLDQPAVRYWIRTAKCHPFSFYMNFSLLTHIAAVNKIMFLYSPKAIITTESENDFSTSFLSGYCESMDASYIGIMHGENFVNPLHAYVRFSKYYVWDAFYIEQYVRTGSMRDFFYVYSPNRYQMNIKIQEQKKYFIAYYLQGQSRAQLESIYRNLLVFSQRGLQCKVRMHARASDRELVKEIFGDSAIEIEKHESVSIEDSYAEAEYIASAYSTVLTDAYQNGLNAVIDDVSDRILYQNLAKMKYINLSRISLRLSDLQRKVEV